MRYEMDGCSFHHTMNVECSDIVVVVVVLLASFWFRALLGNKEDASLRYRYRSGIGIKSCCAWNVFVYVCVCVVVQRPRHSERAYHVISYRSITSYHETNTSSKLCIQYSTVDSPYVGYGRVLYQQEAKDDKRREHDEQSGQILRRLRVHIYHRCRGVIDVALIVAVLLPSKTTGRPVPIQVVQGRNLSLLVWFVVSIVIGIVVVVVVAVSIRVRGRSLKRRENLVCQTGIVPVGGSGSNL